MNEEQQQSNMYQGNWECVSCGAQITELPFQPKSEANLRCLSCHKAQKQQGGASQSQSGERQMYTGNWQCSQCGNAIHQLPFQPKNTENLMCLDCYKASKQ
jgi:CxxC-x17-CxxC domain-containing protein